MIKFPALFQPKKGLQRLHIVYPEIQDLCTGSSIMNDIFLLLISQGYKGQNNSKPFLFIRWQYDILIFIKQNGQLCIYIFGWRLSLKSKNIEKLKKYTEKILDFEDKYRFCSNFLLLEPPVLIFHMLKIDAPYFNSV